jgi:hypothetical protein
MSAVVAGHDPMGMSAENPFAAFLASRPPVTKKASELTQFQFCSDVSVVTASFGQSACDLDTNPFASYLSLRPKREETSSAQGLNAAPGDPRAAKTKATKKTQRSRPTTSQTEHQDQLGSRPPSQSMKLSGKLGASSTLSRSGQFSMSAPDLHKNTATTILPLSNETMYPMSSAWASSTNFEDDSVMAKWWTKTRSWNAKISRDELTASRVNTAIPGGAVVLGDGKMQLINGSHLFTTGYFFAFQIDDLDERNYPLDQVRDMTIGFGISSVPARHRQCEKPLYAYDIPGTILVGYGQHVIDNGSWFKQNAWDTRQLAKGDVVGLQISPEGDFVVWLNGQQALRVPTSLGGKRDAIYKKISVSPRRVVFPIIDLHGRVSSITLLPKATIPNLPLRARNILTETADSLKRTQALASE